MTCCVKLIVLFIITEYRDSDVVSFSNLFHVPICVLLTQYRLSSIKFQNEFQHFFKNINVIFLIFYIYSLYFYNKNNKNLNLNCNYILWQVGTNIHVYQQTFLCTWGHIYVYTIYGPFSGRFKGEAIGKLPPNHGLHDSYYCYYYILFIYLCNRR